MTVRYTREPICEGVAFTSIIDSKFKTATVNLKFLTELKEETSALNALAVGIMGSSNNQYKNLTELTAKLNSLYGTNIGMGVSKMGDMQVLSISVNAINNSYTFDGEDIISEVMDIYTSCLFRPYMENGGFGKEIFNFRKKDLLDSIEAEINNKRSYAIMQAQKVIFEGEASAFSSYGTKKEAGKATPQSVYKAYLDLLKTAQIEIYYVGAHEQPGIKEMFADEFSAVQRKPMKHNFNSFSPLKGTVKEVQEKLDVSQTKMVMAFKSESDDIYPIKLMSTIYGETPFSKLFANVREKLSLCYYCASNYNDKKGTMLVDSGVELANVEKARDEIIKQLDDIKSGNFTEDELNNSVLSIINSLNGVSDTPSSLINWYFSRYCQGEIIEPEEEIKRIKVVSKEQVIDAAKTFKLDTVYIVTGEGE